MYLEDVYQRLIETARQRVRAGVLSERGLARECGMSQPHMHNVLKDIRSLSAASADRLMRALRTTVPELLWRYPGEAETSVRAIPLLRGRIGPGGETGLTTFRGYSPFPGTLVDQLVAPVAARLAPELVLPAALHYNDLVLLDQNPAVRSTPRGRNCWVVSDGSGLRVRYVMVGGTRVYLASETTVDDPQRWQAVPLQGRNILDIVRARIVWIGRELEAEKAGPDGAVSAGN
jgi:hypothetical protein